MEFKQSQLFGWDEEPVDERPSEFVPSRSYSVLPGLEAIKAPPMRRRRPPGRIGFKTMLAFCLGLLALGVYLLVTLAPLVKLAPLLHR
jgi:hypothetical protein